MKQRFYLLLTSMLLCFVATNTAFAIIQTYTYQGVTYEKDTETGLAKVKSGGGLYGVRGDITILDRIYDTATRYYTVTEIEDDAFQNCQKLTSITIPETITKIGSSAFYGCTSLKSVVIPNSVTTIGSSAFGGCSELKSATLSNTLTAIPDDAFFGCKSLESIAIPNSVTTIGWGAFSSCKSLESVVIPNSVTKIGTSAFFYCSNLKSVTLPNAITEIKDMTFVGCTSLESIVIPNTVTTIGSSAFNYCSSLKSITIPSSVNYIDQNAFPEQGEECSVYISDIEAWLGINFNGKYANPLYKPSATATSNLYLNGELLERLDIPASVTKINPYAFAGCSSLKTVSIPNTVTSIIRGAFKNCKNIEEVYCYAATPVDLWYENFDSTFKTATLYVPFASIGQYESADYWKEFATIKPMGNLLTDEAGVMNGVYNEEKLVYWRKNLTAGSYATFCLPFATDLGAASASFDNVYVPNNTALYKSDGKLILLMQKVDMNSSIAAGQPFVAKLKDGVTSVALANNATATIDDNSMDNPEPKALTVFDWDGKSGMLLENSDIRVSFGGSLTTMTGKGSEYETFNSNGSFGPTNNGVVKAFRAYVLKENAAAMSKVTSISFGLGSGDNTTEINTISIPSVANGAIYSIDGRLVSAEGKTAVLPSGIYIKNNKKIVIK